MKVNLQRSPRCNTEHEMGQLCNILRIGTVAVEEMPIFDQLRHFPIALPFRASDDLIADWRPRDDYEWDLILHT